MKKKGKNVCVQTKLSLIIFCLVGFCAAIFKEQCWLVAANLLELGRSFLYFLYHLNYAHIIFLLTIIIIFIKRKNDVIFLLQKLIIFLTNLYWKLNLIVNLSVQLPSSLWKKILTQFLSEGRGGWARATTVKAHTVSPQDYIIIYNFIQTVVGFPLKSARGCLGPSPWVHNWMSRDSVIIHNKIRLFMVPFYFYGVKKIWSSSPALD